VEVAFAWWTAVPVLFASPLTLALLVILGNFWYLANL
jgi:hypothetical protein